MLGTFYFKCFVIIIFDDEMGYWETFWLIYQTYECFPLKFDCSGRISKIYKIKDHVYLAGLMDILLTVMDILLTHTDEATECAFAHPYAGAFLVAGAP